MSERKFEHVWGFIQNHLKKGDEIRVWSAFHGDLGWKITIDYLDNQVIVVISPNAKSTQRIPSEDFKRVWVVWADYKRLVVRRYELRDITRFSTYIISILHWYDQEVLNV